jgi:hypothetical protein
MKILRLVLSVASVSLLAAGFVASTIEALGGQQAEYASKVDQPSVRYAALLVLVLAVGCSLFPDRSNEGPS